MKILLVALRKFWLLIALSALAGGGLGVAAATVLLEPPAPPLWEAKVDAIALAQDEAILLGARYLRDSSVTAEMGWLFAGGGVVGSRASAVGMLLLLDSSVEKMADDVAMSLPELEARIDVDESVSPDVLKVTVWGPTREESEQLVATISSEVEIIITEYFSGDFPPRFLGVTYERPLLSSQSNADELRVWRLSVLPRERDRQVLVPFELESLRLKALEVYLDMKKSQGGDTSDSVTAPPVVSISTPSSNRLEAVVRDSSEEGVTLELDTVVTALEAAGELQSPYQDISAVAVVSVGAATQVLSGPSVDRTPVIVASGVLLGLLLSGLFALTSLSPRRILWSPTQVYQISNSVPVAVLPGRESDRSDSVLAAENPGVSSLRTNLFFSGDTPRLVAFTSPASVADHLWVAMALAESLAQVGRQTVVVDAGAAGHHLGSEKSVRAENKDRTVGMDGWPRTLTHPSAQLAGFDVVSLSREFGGSHDHFLASDWPETLTWLNQNYECVLVALSSVREGVGAVEAAKACARVVVVIRPGTTRPQDLALAVSQLAQAGAPAPEIAVVGVHSKEVPEWYLPVLSDNSSHLAQSR